METNQKSVQISCPVNAGLKTFLVSRVARLAVEGVKIATPLFSVGLTLALILLPQLGIGFAAAAIEPQVSDISTESNNTCTNRNGNFYQCPAVTR